MLNLFALWFLVVSYRDEMHQEYQEYGKRVGPVQQQHPFGLAVTNREIIADQA